MTWEFLFSLYKKQDNKRGPFRYHRYKGRESRGLTGGKELFFRIFMFFVVFLRNVPGVSKKSNYCYYKELYYNIFSVSCFTVHLESTKKIFSGFSNLINSED